MYRTTLVIVGAVLALAGLASAQVAPITAGQAPEAVLITTEVPWDDGWTVGSESEPIPVIIDPEAGPWGKALIIPESQTAPFQGGPLTEYLVVEGFPWEDWHEEILVEGFVWSPNATINYWDPQSQSYQPLPGLSTQLDQTGQVIWFDFDPVPVGTPIVIEKFIQLPQGQSLPPDTAFIPLAEYPTPEPASLGILAGGAVMMLRRRRRHRWA